MPLKPAVRMLEDRERDGGGSRSWGVLAFDLLQGSSYHNRGPGKLKQRLFSAPLPAYWWTTACVQGGHKVFTIAMLDCQ